jgi:hypothetical protein
LDTALTNARLDGTIQIDAFADDSRAEIEHVYSLTPSGYAVEQVYEFRNAMNSYESPRWYKQPNYVEVWIEKQSLYETFTGILEDKQVVVAANKGYPGLSFLNQAVERLRDALDELGREKIVILYFGDLDPSGDSMDDIIVTRLKQINTLQGYGLPFDDPDHFEFRRIALLPEQVEEYHLPSQQDTALKQKLGRDPRAKGFQAKYGSLFQYEVDALSAIVPDEFAGTVRGTLDELYHENVWNQYKHEVSEDAVKEEFDKRVKFTEEALDEMKLFDRILRHEEERRKEEEHKEKKKEAEN